MRRIVRMVPPKVLRQDVPRSTRIYGPQHEPLIHFLSSKFRLDRETVRALLASQWAYIMSEVIRHKAKFFIPGVGTIKGFIRKVERAHGTTYGTQLIFNRGDLHIAYPLEPDEEDAGPNDDYTNWHEPQGVTPFEEPDDGDESMAEWEPESRAKTPRAGKIRWE